MATSKRTIRIQHPVSSSKAVTFINSSGDEKRRRTKRKNTSSRSVLISPQALASAPLTLLIPAFSSYTPTAAGRKRTREGKGFTRRTRSRLTLYSSLSPLVAPQSAMPLCIASVSEVFDISNLPLAFYFEQEREGRRAKRTSFPSCESLNDRILSPEVFPRP